jgi:phage repressor protein C with HTH and peptisase S24 domain
MTSADRLKDARIRAGYETAKQAAEALGVPVTTYVSHENGQRGFPASKAAQYARFFRVAPEWLLYGRGGKPEETTLPPLTPVLPSRLVSILGVVQAGMWMELADNPQNLGEIPVFLPSYANANLFALTVRGSSMNRVFPDNSTVIVCPVAESGVRDGAYVVVQRRDGDKVETTLKQVVQGAGEIALWPRSDDAAYQTPMIIKANPHSDNGFAIIGVVVASMLIVPPPNGPLLSI